MTLCIAALDDEVPALFVPEYDASRASSWLARHRICGGPEHSLRISVGGRDRPAACARGGAGQRECRCHLRQFIHSGRAFLWATTTIPIVFSIRADPVGTGDVVSLARPVGNITGLSSLRTDIAVRELESLKEALPHTTRIAVCWSPETPSHSTVLKAVEAAGQAAKLRCMWHPLKPSTISTRHSRL
jgi:hypothetical protein